MNLTALAEKVVAAHAANVETLHALALGAIERTERLTALNLNVSRSLLEDGAIDAKDLFAADAPDRIVARRSMHIGPRMERAIAYARSMSEISVGAHDDVSGLAQRWFADQSRIFRAALDEASQSAPVGSDAVLAAIRSAASISNDLYERVSEAGAQTSDDAGGLPVEATDGAARSGTKAASARKTKTVNEGEA